jgi:UDP-N-acetylglucosamine--N-acetylmuramyl-(pentapeptide) pyrophosphoryl-undecaprenol N-acetylglucosamine transferase
VRVFFTGGGTGGHLYPALAIARALVRAAPEVRPHFIGARRGIEREILPNAGFPFTLLELHPLYRARPWQNWRTLVGMGGALRAIGRLAREDRPALTVATGGYASGATLLYSRLRGIPYVLQEQNAFPGKTVAFFSKWAREVYVGFPEAALRLPPAVRSRAVDAGNPIEPPPATRPDRAATRAAWGLSAADRVLLVFGGSQGSLALNTTVEQWVKNGLPRGLGVIWATGRDHFTRYAGLASASVVVRPYLSPIAEAYAASDLALTRAGAMTTAELCAWGLPMVLIPLPTAAADHQTANARALAEAGAARWIPQGEATAARVDALVRELLGHPETMHALSDAAAARARPAAAAEIARRLLRLLRGGEPNERA